MQHILELRDLVKHYPGHQAVDGVSLAIPQGGFYSLLGPSGCGKTTTLRMVAGFETPTSGDVLLDGEVVNHRRPYERNVTTVFQSYALFPHLTVRGNVEFGLRRRGAKDMAQARERGDRAGRALRGRRTATPRSFRAASGSASRSRGRWCSSPPCSCSTSRWRRSTPSCASRCAWS